MEKAKLDDRDKVVGDPDRDPGIRAPRSAGDGDCDLAKRSEQDAIAGQVRVLERQFLWLNARAKDLLERLRRDLQEADRAPWIERLLEGALQVALAAGSAGIGLYIASKLVPEGQVTVEAVKALFEQGINTGVEAGRSKLREASTADVVNAFIDSQQAAVWATHRANETHFVDVEVPRITSSAEARALRDACSDQHLEEAARQQYDASRNSWLSYLAQARFGAMRDRTTDMSDQQTRDRINRYAPGFVPGNAPDLGDALGDRAPGILMVRAELPFILGGTSMPDRPRVDRAYLNGVHSKIRDQYEGRPLAAARIPRVVEAKVAGMPDFVLNVDEHGAAVNLPHVDGMWLQARATVGHPEHASKDDFGKKLAGVVLLLQELVPTTIRSSPRGIAGYMEHIS